LAPWHAYVLLAVAENSADNKNVITEFMRLQGDFLTIAPLPEIRAISFIARLASPFSTNRRKTAYYITSTIMQKQEAPANCKQERLSSVGFYSR
jgi:hypothetical protein